MLKDRAGDQVTRVCDDCGDEKRVSYWNAYKKDVHRCYRCSNKLTNLGKTPWNKGYKQQPKNVGNIYTHSDGYPMVWVGKTNINHGYMPAHRLVMSDLIGRLVTKEEKVHHVNADKEDFRPVNLYLCNDMSHHRKVHAHLETLSMSLVKMGLIEFDHAKGEYSLSRPMEQFIEEELGELLETPNEKDEGNQQPSSADLAEKVQRLFREEVHQKSGGSAQPLPQAG